MSNKIWRVNNSRHLLDLLCLFLLDYLHLLSSTLPSVEQLDLVVDPWPFLIQVMLRNSFQSLPQSQSINQPLGLPTSLTWDTWLSSCQLDSTTALFTNVLLENSLSACMVSLPRTFLVLWSDSCLYWLRLCALFQLLLFQRYSESHWRASEFGSLKEEKAQMQQSALMKTMMNLKKLKKDLRKKLLK